MIKINDLAENEVEVDNDGSLFGFRFKDRIRIDALCSWHNKECGVIGSRNDELWLRDKNSKKNSCLKNAQGLVLLERPGLRYKVGDVLRIDGHKAVIAAIDPEKNTFFVTHKYFPLVSKESPLFAKPWWPKELTKSINGRCLSEKDIEKILSPRSMENIRIITESQESIAIPGIPETVRSRIPEWLTEMMLRFKAGVANFFIIWGNIHDWQRTMQGDHKTLYEYLGDIFCKKDLIMIFSLSTGLQFANKEMENTFRARFLGASKAKASSGAPQTEMERQKAEFAKNQATNAPISSLIGDTPATVLSFLEGVLTDTSPGKLSSVLIIDSAHNIASNDVTGQGGGDKVTIEILDRWTRNNQIKEAGNAVIMLTPWLTNITPILRSSQSKAAVIRIPKPNEDERRSRWEYNHSLNGVKFSDGLTPEILGRITNGLSLMQIDEIYKLARENGEPITLNLIKKKKQEILEAEYGHLVKVIVPTHGFDFFGGKEKIKDHFLEIRGNIFGGILRRTPMGILITGPPGTGKTFFLECFAYECRINCVKLGNIRNMYVGQSEEREEMVEAAIDDMSPTIVIEDEADQSETSRDAPCGDTGVSNRIRQARFIFTSDPKRRGKVIWIRVSNRPDLLDEAYKREGRSDDTIAFTLPRPDEFESIFKVMFARYQIPTTITDFGPYAKAVAEKIYCTGASVESMVLEADKYAGREKLDYVEDRHLWQAISDWEMKLDRRKIDQQIILSIEGSSKRLRDENWEEALLEAKKRLQEETPQMMDNTIFPGFGKMPNVLVKQ